jgi:hypothetical protein
MRSRAQARRRSVDRGMYRLGIQPRKNLTPGCRRCRRKRKATSGASPLQDAPEPRAVTDPTHVRKRLAREPGEPTSAYQALHGWPHREVQGRTPMMHGRGQSDRFVVPAKSPNKTGRSVAEGMEGRNLAKGKPSQQNQPIGLSAAPGWPSALARIRHVASFGLWRHHLRQEPDAVVPLVRICAGGGPKGPSLPRLLSMMSPILSDTISVGFRCTAEFLNPGRGEPESRTAHRTTGWSTSG